MILRSDARYDLITLSSMGVRMTPAGRQPVHLSSLYELQATSAETNVLNVAASLGLHTKVLTKFVKDSPLAHFIRADLRRRGIEYEGAEALQGGPWGYRHQFNIADSGFGARAPRVWNDRAGEVGLTLRADEFDLQRLFAREGCRVLHLSGLIAALSRETGACCLELIGFARRHGARVSFDLNYRESFWQGRQSELRALFTQIAAASDILIGNEEDFQKALGLQGPPAGQGGVAGQMDGFRAMIGVARAAFPQAAMFVTTLREVIDAGRHGWGALLWADGQWYDEPLREIAVLDRIGGGDGFVGGLLYGILKGWPPQQGLRFGWAAGALATTTVSDYATPISEAQLWDIYGGNARVVR